MQRMATAKPCVNLGMQLEPEGLKEINYGKWEGQSETVSRDYHDDYIRWSADPWYPPTGGELARSAAPYL